MMPTHRGCSAGWADSGSVVLNAQVEMNIRGNYVIITIEQRFVPSIN
jgi:hypothetical protein